MSQYQQQLDTSGLSANSATFIEGLYESYLENPESVSPEWMTYFDKLIASSNLDQDRDVAHSQIIESFIRLGKLQGSSSWSANEQNMEAEAAQKQVNVLKLLTAYRQRGHHAATLDPINLRDETEIHELNPAHHGISEADMDMEFNTGTLQLEPTMKLRDMIDVVSKIYAGNMGFEYMHITKTEERRWLQRRIEATRGDFTPSTDVQKRLLKQLVAADGLERYLGTKYVGQKRFSLEGGDSLIPLMDSLIQSAGTTGAQEVVIGMAHRGRLNVLINTLGKSPADLFDEFEGKKRFEGTTSGDVKYHMGFSSDVTTPGGNVHLTLGFNPSHLEIVNPVVEGSVRARLLRHRGEQPTGMFETVLPVLIHGDAAFAGQGVVAETFQLSQVRGYRTGGSIHVIINNQIGFTTSNLLDARSTHYCSDVAKMVQAPILHVNGDDPEAVLFAAQLAVEYRAEFQKDIVIDMVCYRRLGHNEADEPSATQPMMYKKIKAHKTPAKIYAKKLESNNVIDNGYLRKVEDEYRSKLDKGEQVSPNIIEGHVSYPWAVNWSGFNKKREWYTPVDTTITAAKLTELSDDILSLPDGFKVNARVNKILEDRRKMAAGEVDCDWGFAENLAYASLVDQDYKVRLSGQDAGRGTFFHRHAVLHHQETGESYIPLRNMDNVPPTAFTVLDSILSEEAVLGFEYGFSLSEPQALTIWEAQFGDFANGAQVLFDQFISSGEAKWGRFTGLTCLLPHGYEGQGPEHSSARLERYLQLCAEKNMQVVVPSTPAQCFHMLRRQMVRDFRMPLIVMSPKSLLRHPLAVNPISDFTERSFQTIIDEIDNLDSSQVKRLVLCSGKVYYDLLQKRRELNLQNTAIIRIEQLYPFPRAEYKALIERYSNASEFIWCQEEPQNQGAYYQVRQKLLEPLKHGQNIKYAGRNASASTAVGYHAVHVEQQNKLVSDALGLPPVTNN
jgi:2-oxoglutarate dehydrogenase E1 component